MIQLDLAPEDVRTLSEVLTVDLSELGYEIANTDAKSYRDRLKLKRQLLERVVRQLDEASPDG